MINFDFILLKKVTKLSEDSISTLDEAKKYTTRT